MLLCAWWSHGCLDLLVAYGKGHWYSGADKKSATNVSTPVHVFIAALGVDRKSVTSKTFIQLITIIKPSWDASYKYWITKRLWYESDQKLTCVFVRWAFRPDHPTAYNHHGYHHNNNHHHHHHQYYYRDLHYDARLYIPQQQPFIWVWPQWQEAIHR